MLAVKLEDSTIAITISFRGEENEASKRELIRILLSDLGEKIAGKDQESGTTYACTLNDRFLKIKASRPAWRSSWNADTQVICPDLLQPEDDKIQLVCPYLFGPKRNVVDQVTDANDAAKRIGERIKNSLDILTKEVETYIGRIKISV